MTSTRKFRCDDLFRFNNVNLDVLTETYNMSFYLQYLTKWPDYFLLQEDPNGTMMGYVMGKAEGKGENWHGHVTAVTVAPEFRRLGLAKNLMDYLENVSVELYDGYFVDLFVRVSNTLAIGMYEKFGYSVYRRVLGYYSGDDDGEDAFDMRKALPRDKDKKSIIPLPYPVMPDSLMD
ncbi:N-alpha-acetyltransferase 20, NatB catalytic subunit, variant [Aphanomyces invadans]|uniref:N-alpha-acetyltransferase 20, NatB catalytic subunit, variant n=1 Tax=Aphanomyces invadans TaxID=157072 RepID=A0A024TLQ9_9STRA|nr:N-alpha-acetyltransferase 20, NatB catalytic subunit, variant [Aphanomyces invadans]ETV94894.1 N-alpha-acetyltransferase 20, NatB catalytic subunit, variant [Aphanomyces invadans]|eukprot:XP_008876485.1 N-alpha-acetyltransferase 20, NatB catalytic subunit, variant [Aphanomyces invadans]